MGPIPQIGPIPQMGMMNPPMFTGNQMMMGGMGMGTSMPQPGAQSQMDPQQAANLFTALMAGAAAMTTTTGPLRMGPNSGIPQGDGMQRPLDPLLQYINENRHEGARDDLSDLLPPVVRERPLPRGENT